MSKVRELHDRAFQCRRPVTCEELAYAIEAEEAEAAKARELPDDIRVIVDTLRRSHITSGQVHRLVAFIDATFPKPVPQWELDAQKVEAGAVPVSERAAIAARIREAHRESK
jgi:hypothetical protein